MKHKNNRYNSKHNKHNKTNKMNKRNRHNKTNKNKQNKVKDVKGVKGVKGGEVIASGGFGCVFSPALLCKNSKTRKQNYISKLMKTKYAMQEYNEIMDLQSILNKIPHYTNYFMVNNITICQPAKITQTDLKHYKQNCSALPKDDITVQNINNSIDKLMTVNIPYGGIPIDDYIYNKKNYTNLVSLNKSLIQLLLKGIIPMNKLHVFHNDIKDSNILVDVANHNSINTRLIDWGLSTHYIPFKNSPFPIQWKNRPFQYNVPFSIILFSDYFVDKYTTYLTTNKNPTHTELFDFVDKYIDYWLDKRGQGHYKLIIKIIHKLTDTKTETNDIIIHYIVTILLSFTKNTNANVNKNLREYLDTVFIHNVDKWGLLSSYYPLLCLLNDNYKKLSTTQMQTHDLLKSMFIFLYSTPKLLEIHTITDYLYKLNDLLRLENNYVEEDSLKGFKVTNTSKKITGKTYEITPSEKSKTN
jgi:hypothetical protein